MFNVYVFCVLKSLYVLFLYSLASVKSASIWLRCVIFTVRHIYIWQWCCEVRASLVQERLRFESTNKQLLKLFSHVWSI